MITYNTHEPPDNYRSLARALSPALTLAPSGVGAVRPRVDILRVRHGVERASALLVTDLYGGQAAPWPRDHHADEA